MVSLFAQYITIDNDVTIIDHWVEASDEFNISQNKFIEIPRYPVYKNIIVKRNQTIKNKFLGVQIADKLYKDAYKDKNIISIWSVPIGDRNFIEYPKCRNYEKEKGVCYEI